MPNDECMSSELGRLFATLYKMFYCQLENILLIEILLSLHLTSGFAGMHV